MPNVELEVVNVTRCSTHGLIGGPEVCPHCAIPCERTLAIPTRQISTVWAALEGERDRWRDHALDASALAHENRLKIRDAQDGTHHLVAALKKIEELPDGPIEVARETALVGLRDYFLRLDEIDPTETAVV